MSKDAHERSKRPCSFPELLPSKCGRTEHGTRLRRAPSSTTIASYPANARLAASQGSHNPPDIRNYMRPSACAAPAPSQPNVTGPPPAAAESPPDAPVPLRASPWRPVRRSRQDAPARTHGTRRASLPPPTAHEPGRRSQYTDSFWRKMVEDARRVAHAGGYCSSFAECPSGCRVTPRGRAEIVKYIFEVGSKVDQPLSDYAQFLGVTIFDRFMFEAAKKNKVFKESVAGDLEVVGAACLFLASKLEDQCPFSASDACMTFDNGSLARRQDLLKWERQIANLLCFDLNAPTVLDFIWLVFEKDEFSQCEHSGLLRSTVVRVARHICYSDQLVFYPSHLLAVAIILIVDTALHRKQQRLSNLPASVRCMLGTDQFSLKEVVEQVHDVINGMPAQIAWWLHSKDGGALELSKPSMTERQGKGQRRPDSVGSTRASASSEGIGGNEEEVGESSKDAEGMDNPRTEGIAEGEDSVPARTSAEEELRGSAGPPDKDTSPTDSQGGSSAGSAAAAKRVEINEDGDGLDELEGLSQISTEVAAERTGHLAKGERCVQSLPKGMQQRDRLENEAAPVGRSSRAAPQKARRPRRPASQSQS